MTVSIERSFISLVGGSDQLILKMNEAQAYLRQTRSDFAKHIKTAHGGWPATTCHRCLTYKQGIQSNERFIIQAESELDNSTQKN
jgi:hypothetical protein